MEDVMKKHIKKCYQKTKKLFVFNELYRATRKNKGETFIQTSFLPIPVMDITNYLNELEVEGVLKVKWEDVGNPPSVFHFTGNQEKIKKVYDSEIESLIKDVDYDTEQSSFNKQIGDVKKAVAHKKELLRKTVFNFSFDDLPEEIRPHTNLYLILLYLTAENTLLAYPPPESCGENTPETEPIIFKVDYELGIKKDRYFIDLQNREVIFNDKTTFSFKNSERAYELFFAFTKIDSNKIPHKDIPEYISYDPPLVKTDEPEEVAKRLMKTVRKALNITAESKYDILLNQNKYIRLRD